MILFTSLGSVNGLLSAIYAGAVWLFTAEVQCLYLLCAEELLGIGQEGGPCPEMGRGPVRGGTRVSRLFRFAAVGTAVMTMLAVASPTYAASPSTMSPSAAVATPAVTSGYIGSVTVSEAQLEAAGKVKVVNAPKATVQPMAGCLYDCLHVRDVSYWYEGQIYETQAQANHKNVGTTGQLTMSVTLSVSNSWSASVGISAGPVTAGVGFDVTNSASVLFQHTVDVPAYTCVQIKAYELVAVYKFNVYQEPFIGSDTRIGNGWAQRRDGQRFDVYYC